MAITAMPISLAVLGEPRISGMIRLPPGTAKIDAFLVVSPERNVDPNFSAALAIYKSTDGGKTSSLLTGGGKNSGFEEWLFTPRIAGGEPSEINPKITENWPYEICETCGEPWGDCIATGITIADPTGIYVGVACTVFSGADAGVNRGVVLVARDLNGTELEFDPATWVGVK
jgi:hypothetical protein